MPANWVPTSEMVICRTACGAYLRFRLNRMPKTRQYHRLYSISRYAYISPPGGLLNESGHRGIPTHRSPSLSLPFPYALPQHALIFQRNSHRYLSTKRVIRHIASERSPRGLRHKPPDFWSMMLPTLIPSRVCNTFQ
ncbi:hypothetical protein BBBOND_0311210 [Babesia bigemina]|uniref:Uncharacterized protein n=1 Tax=Babesia bigemina TaxID=5866 RepID=A0A061D9K4_BABBI|nr:hypothetical protein BBBOND_0311210 [Babesia bigemina]CDR97218.1 hypothetical protein BBBOND_0311210 [Babesia bigemina]|eukprot:XP_012769404.1 hypothetical protein BBBOND_0311210 [Babesia bigemina]